MSKSSHKLKLKFKQDEVRLEKEHEVEGRRCVNYRDLSGLLLSLGLFHLPPSLTSSKGQRRLDEQEKRTESRGT